MHRADEDTKPSFQASSREPKHFDIAAFTAEAARHSFRESVAHVICDCAPRLKHRRPENLGSQ